MRKRIYIDLGEDHQMWLDLSKSLNQKPNTLARVALKKLIEDYKQNIIDNIKYQNHITEKEEPCQIHIRLNNSEATLLKAYAKEFNYSNARAVIAILRSVLKQEIQFTIDEKVLLKESNKELRAIGNNLNQITKRINNINFSNFNTDKLELLIKSLYENNSKLSERILKHTKAVYKLINKSKRRSENE